MSEQKKKKTSHCSEMNCFFRNECPPYQEFLSLLGLEHNEVSLDVQVNVAAVVVNVSMLFSDPDVVIC